MAELDLTAFYGQFRDEAWENLNILEQGLTELEARPDDTALLDRMLRAVHTTKGSAKIMGFAEVNSLAHEIEEVLSAIRKASTRMTAETGNVLLQASQAIRTLTLNRIEGRSDPVDVNALIVALKRLLGIEEPAAEAAPVVTVAATATAGRPRETMRVDLEHVDHLARLIGETLALQQQAVEERGLLRDFLMDQEEVQLAFTKLEERLTAYRDRFRPRQAEEVSLYLALLENALANLSQRSSDYHRNHTALLERFALALEELRQQSLALRMVPIGTLFEIFPGVVRRMAGEAGIEVALEVRGADVELDRRVLDMLREPLVHLVRNALAHGIEPPEERFRQHKPRRGGLLLEATQQGRRVQVHVRDDGRGIDLEKVRRTAVERGLLDEERARAADERTLTELLFRPAFTTRRQVDDLSGRGVGLDVVQATMRQLNGTVQVQSQPGCGTTFTLDVPLTLATVRVLLVEAGNATVAVPSNAVRSLVRIRPVDVVPVEGRPTLHWQEHSVPIVALAQILGLTAAAPGGPRPALIVGADGHPTALVVDGLLDEVEVVVRPLGEILGMSPFFSSATLLGSDQVVPILDLAGLLSARPILVQTGGAEPVQIAAPRRQMCILLVEDAITTRELERSILEAAGYSVETAFDGVDALQRLEQGSFQLIITDIEMPRMDGFELTARVRQNPQWAGLPIVIISARSDEESRRQGLQVGAQAYISKSRFDQGNLLETIAQLVG
jgi:two-component system chemotaxis sensor kinase CheA